MKSMKLFLVAILFLVPLVMCGKKDNPASTEDKPPAYNITGKWYLKVTVTGGVQLPVGTEFMAELDLQQTEDGDGTGSIITEGGATSQLTGHLSDINWTFTLHQILPCTGTFHGSGRITENGSKLTGSYSGSDCNGAIKASIISINYIGSETGSMTDIDGNTYKTIKIGEQWWMAENLKVTHYRDGTAIPNVTNDSSWISLTTGAYCDYDNKPVNSSRYGRLYNINVLTNSSNIAPAGWHIPSPAEWETLADHLGGMQVAGDKLKEAGTAHWTCANSTATNESGFTALPAGIRNAGGVFEKSGEYTSFWSLLYLSISVPFPIVSSYQLSCTDPGLSPLGSNSKQGASIRLVQDSSNN